MVYVLYDYPCVSVTIAIKHTTEPRRRRRAAADAVQDAMDGAAAATHATART